MTTNVNANRPVHKVRIAGVTAAIWQHAAKDEDKTRYTITVAKNYRDGAGKWQQTGHFSPGDLLALAKAADLAHTRIIQQINED